jgi:hypothetical protein
VAGFEPATPSSRTRGPSANYLKNHAASVTKTMNRCRTLRYIIAEPLPRKSVVQVRRATISKLRPENPNYQCRALSFRRGGLSRENLRYRVSTLVMKSARDHLTLSPPIDDGSLINTHVARVEVQPVGWSASLRSHRILSLPWRTPRHFRHFAKTGADNRLVGSSSPPSPTTQSHTSRDFPGIVQLAPNWPDFVRALCLC